MHHCFRIVIKLLKINPSQIARATNVELELSRDYFSTFYSKRPHRFIRFKDTYDEEMCTLIRLIIPTITSLH